MSGTLNNRWKHAQGGCFGSLLLLPIALVGFAFLPIGGIVGLMIGSLAAYAAFGSLFTMTTGQLMGDFMTRLDVTCPHCGKTNAMVNLSIDTGSPTLRCYFCSATITFPKQPTDPPVSTKLRGAQRKLTKEFQVHVIMNRVEALGNLGQAGVTLSDEQADRIIDLVADLSEAIAVRDEGAIDTVKNGFVAICRVSAPFSDGQMEQLVVAPGRARWAALLVKHKWQTAKFTRAPAGSACRIMFREP